MTSWHGLGLAPCAAVAALALGWPAATGDAQRRSPVAAVRPAPVGRTPAGLARELADRIATAWLKRQRRDGSFHDYVADHQPPSAPPRDAYGPSLLGAALVAHGLHSDRPDAVAGGLRSIRFALRRHPLARSVFDALGLAVGYGRDGELPRSPPLHAVWRGALRRSPWRLTTLVVPPGRAGFNNQQLVAALAALETRAALTRAGERPAGATGALPSRVAGLLSRKIPAVAATQGGRSPAGATAILSDVPSAPIAYHALTLGMLGRVLTLAGSRAPVAARRALIAAARASWALMAPDGDVAWWGRSQEESWTLAMTAAGAVAASRDPEAGAIDRARFMAVAQRALERLWRAHGGARVGVWITPASRLGGTTAIRSLDWYAAAASYTGLTLLALDWVATDPAAHRHAPPVGLGSDTDGTVVLGQTGRFAVVRHGAVWMAVGARPAPPQPTHADFTRDLRYDPGLSLVLVRERTGGWRPLMPPRPRTTTWDSTGPLLERHGVRARLVGRRLQGRRGAAVVVDGDFVTERGRVLRHAAVRFAATSCGVTIAVPGRRGDTWELSSFWRSAPRRDGPLSIAGGGVRVAADARARVALRGGYASGTEPRLVRARLRVRVAAARRVTFAVCVAGMAEAAAPAPRARSVDGTRPSPAIVRDS